MNLSKEHGYAWRNTIANQKTQRQTGTVAVTIIKPQGRYEHAKLISILISYGKIQQRLLQQRIQNQEYVLKPTCSTVTRLNLKQQFTNKLLHVMLEYRKHRNFRWGLIFVDSNTHEN